jgi:dihydroorotase
LYDLIIRDGTIVRSTGRLVADIAIEDGKIAYVGSNPAGGAREEFSAIGRFIIPGAIDTHVHFRDPGHPGKESWASGSREAVRNGVTTVFDMPNTYPPTVNERAVREKLEIAGSTSVANFGIWAGATADNLDLLGDLHESGLVCGTKVFMGDSTGALAVSTETLHGIFEHSKGLIGVHAEDQPILEAAKAQWAGTASPCHNDVRPPEASIEAVRTLIDLVEKTGRTVHICHLSTAGEIGLMEAVRRDLPITCEVAPHHLFLSVDSAQDQGNLIKVNPPIRTELDRRAMWAAVKRGLIDSFASDHAPHTLEEKGQDYWDAPSGVPGVGQMLPLLLGAIKHGRLSLERLVEMSCERPAAIFDIADKGKIEQGADADLVMFREGLTTKLTQEMVTAHCGWTPYLGREVGLSPDLVVVGGRVAAESGQLRDDLQPGRLVGFGRAQG